jgi:tripartite-type tricarboxylate transporter receptor subunit TctC
MVVPSAAGGALDVFGRILAPRFSELLGQTVIVENMAGAGAMLGVARAAKAPPDGYQFVLGTASTHAQSQTLYKKPPFNSAFHTRRPDCGPVDGAYCPQGFARK